MTQNISQNGWPVPPAIPVVDWKVNRAGVVIPLLDNAVGWSLAHFAAWFNDHVEHLDQAEGCWGFTTNKNDVLGSVYSNHNSGTAEDLNATLHPYGGAGLDGFTFDQINAIHTRLAWMHRLATGNVAPGSDSNVGDWVWRWGHDYHNSPVDGMHFEYNRAVGSFAGKFYSSVRTWKYAKLVRELNPTHFGSR